MFPKGNGVVQGLDDRVAVALRQLVNIQGSRFFSVQEASLPSVTELH